VLECYKAGLKLQKGYTMLEITWHTRTMISEANAPKRYTAKELSNLRYNVRKAGHASEQEDDAYQREFSAFQAFVGSSAFVEDPLSLAKQILASDPIQNFKPDVTDQQVPDT
jgi:hypothetical protein